MNSNAQFNRNAQSTLAFTLPISCQICLGKVKQPVICPNHHVFCSVCMDTWLQRNQQCPACRVQITTENPCQPVLGGLNPQTDNEEKYSSKELRRCRMELVYKEYENEIERLEGELQATKLENKELWRRVKDKDQTVSSRGPESPARNDMSMISAINNKLKDATKLYENIKTDLKIVKEENTVLKGQSENWRRENQSLRAELVGRSPRKFGRLTVATLENKVEGCEKEIKQLQKALERSDQYISELEVELDKFRNGKGACAFCDYKGKHNGNGKRDADFDNSKLDDSELPSRISSMSDQLSDISPKKRTNRDEESFGLEMPSPMSQATLSTATIADNDQDSFLLPKPSPFKDNPVDAAKKKLRFSLPDQNTEEYLTGNPQQLYSHESHVKFTRNFTNTTMPPTNTDFVRPEPSGSRTSQPNLNVSMTPEMEDCLRLMDQAEQRRKVSSPPQSVACGTFLRQGSFGQESLSAYTTGLIANGPQITMPNIPTFNRMAPASSFVTANGTTSRLGTSGLFPSAPNLVSHSHLLSGSSSAGFGRDPMVITRSVSQYSIPKSGNTQMPGHE